MRARLSGQLALPDYRVSLASNVAFVLDLHGGRAVASAAFPSKWGISAPVTSFIRGCGDLVARG
jgi:hypothetical protein